MRLLKVVRSPLKNSLEQHDLLHLDPRSVHFANTLAPPRSLGRNEFNRPGPPPLHSEPSGETGELELLPCSLTWGGRGLENARTSEQVETISQEHVINNFGGSTSSRNYTRHSWERDRSFLGSLPWIREHTYPFTEPYSSMGTVVVTLPNYILNFVIIDNHVRQTEECQPVFEYTEIALMTGHLVLSDSKT